MKRILNLLTSCLLVLACSSIGVAADDSSDFDHETSFEELKEKLLSRYQQLVQQLAGAEQATMLTVKMHTYGAEEGETGAQGLVSWWHESASAPLSGTPQFTETDISGLYSTTLDNSSQIKVFSYLPLIRKTTIQEADGEFDTKLYANGKYSELDEPVGDELKTGGPDRYLEESGSIAVGLERKFLPGTKVAIEQEFSNFDTNSIYLTPEEQGHSKTSLTLTQPLLKGFGPDYNGAIEELAEIDYESANSELKRQIDSHLLEIARAYWGLYRERSIYLQKQRLADKTEEIVRKMQERKDIDVDPSLLARARSQMFGHQLAADEAQFAILNAQSRIWTLSNAPELVSEGGLEFVTVQQPKHTLPEESMANILETALAERPEVDQSIRQLQSAILRHYRSRNELLPDLDLFAQTYVKGLEGDYDHSGAWDESWDEGDPSYSVGMKFGFPLLNNASRARELRKKLEIRQLLSQLDTTVTNILLEAQISFREMIKYHMAMQRRYAVVESTNEEITGLLNRIDYLISSNEEYGSILNRLLDAIERLNQAEMDFTTSELTYNLALYQLKSAKGTLIEESKVKIEETEEEDLPVNKITIDPLAVKDGSLKFHHQNVPEDDTLAASHGMYHIIPEDIGEPVSTLFWLRELVEQDI